MTDSGIEQGRHKVSVEHLVVSEGKDVLKEQNDEISKGHGSRLL